VRVLVERVDGNLIPTVTMLSASELEVGNSYGARPEHATAIIDSTTLPDAGEYSLRVESYDGDTTGRYQLTVIPLATAEDNINNTIDVGSVNLGESVEGTITPTHWYHRYTFEATADDYVNIVAERT